MAEKPFILLPLNDNSEFPVLSGQIEEWQKLYPAVDVWQQLRNMKGWLDANTSHRKTRSGIKRFVNNWLMREQDKACRMRASPATTQGLTWAQKEDEAYRQAMQAAMERDRLQEERERAV